MRQHLRARRAETAEKSKIQCAIDEKAFICKGWRCALCTFCVLGGAIRRRQIGRHVRQGGAIRQDGNAGGAAGGRGCYTMQGNPVYGEGGSGKTAGPFWAWGRIHHPHPLPHSTAFNLPLPGLIPPRKITPPSLIPIRIRCAEGLGWGAGKEGGGVFENGEAK